MSGKRIKDFDADDFKQLHILLLKWAKFLGIKEAPDEEQIVMLIIFTTEHHKNFTLAMVKEAFNLAIARKLPNINPEHYQNFSAIYVGGIFGAYYDYTERARKAYLTAQSSIDNSENQPSPSDAESGMPTLIKECIENRNKVELSGEVVYDYLASVDLISLSSKEKLSIMKKAKVRATQQAKKSNKEGKIIGDIKDILATISEHPTPKNEKVISLCKRMGLIVFLDKLGEEGRENLLKNVVIKSNDRLTAIRESEQKS